MSNLTPADKQNFIDWLLLEDVHAITLDDTRPTARSILIGNDRIAALFDTPRPDLTLPSGRLRRVNLGGKTVLPAFTDSHIHLLHWGIALGQANLERARSAEESVRDLAQFHKTRPVEKGKWVIGQ